MKFILTLALAFLLYTGNASAQKISQREVYDKIIEIGILEPEIVLKQAIHESGHFKSNGARNKNNILGLMKSKGKSQVLIYFESVFDCLTFYKEHVQSRYDGGDYYRFLKRIGYAKDPHYKRRVSRVELDFIVE